MGLSPREAKREAEISCLEAHLFPDVGNIRFQSLPGRFCAQAATTSWRPPSRALASPALRKWLLRWKKTLWR